MCRQKPTKDSFQSLGKSPFEEFERQQTMLSISFCSYSLIPNCLRENLAESKEAGKYNRSY